MGARGHDGLLRGGRRDRGAPQSGGHARARGVPAVSSRQGRTVHLRADGRRVRRVGGGVRDVSRSADRVRQRGAPGHRTARHRRHLGHLPAAVSRSFPGGFIDQVVGTALLVGVIFGITDARNSPPAAGLTPLVVGLLVVLIGATFGFNSGYAINPARDFAPRLFTFVAGWGGDVFRAGNGWWWVPVIAPCVGGLVGAWIYDFCVGNRFPKQP